MQIKDAEGNISAQDISGNSILDTTPPTYTGINNQ
jgi:hypothetical protein